MEIQESWNVKRISTTIILKIRLHSGYIPVSREVFHKTLHTRQSEIILKFPRENSPNPSLNCRSCFRNVRRFNYHFGFVVEKIIEFGHTKISMFRPLAKFRILTSVSTLGEFLQIEVWTLWEHLIFVWKCKAIPNNVLLLLSMNPFGFSTLRTSTHGNGCSKN